MINGFSMTKISERQIPLLRRSIGVIFQDFRLIERKTVYENLAFAMRAVGASSKAIKARIPYVLDLTMKVVPTENSNGASPFITTVISAAPEP